MPLLSHFYTFKLLKTIKCENPSITILTLNSYILPCPNTGENDIKTILIHNAVLEKMINK